ncbi:MAG: ribonuclease E activity regulator RraA [Betaproteobacteria bacterium]|nr:MAG: ribonuclease activity regulator protein RraA [Betaproteobacteria bacterium SG8_41]UCF75005.1 MAG: ribonuclease E activity regulator RraA [Betaproteobacteria bacterium]
MKFQTVDLCDKYKGSVQVALPVFRPYGKIESFHGAIETVKCYEDNEVVRETLSKSGQGKVLVVDAGGSLNCALVGDVLAGIGARRGWSGIILNGCVRDVRALGRIRIGIRALGSVPLASDKHGLGVVGVPVTFAGVDFLPGQFVYCDADGIVVSEQRLT